MGLKRSCGSASGIGHQHGGLHLHKALSVQISSDCGNNLRPFHKGFLYFLVHNQIRVSLAVTDIRVCQAVIFFRKYLKALGKKGNACGVYGNLLRFGLKHFAGNSHNIAYVVLLKIGIRLLSNAVSCHIALNISLQVLNIAEGCLSHHAFLHDTACNGDVFPLHLLIVFFYIPAVGSHIVLRDFKRVFARFLKSGELFPFYFQKLSDILFFVRIVCLLLISLLFRHFSTPYQSVPAAGNRRPLNNAAGRAVCDSLCEFCQLER